MGKKEDVSKAFQSEAEFEEAYERFLGNLPQAGKRIADSHARMEVCFRDYLDAFEMWVFRHAYECGYTAAMALVGGTDREAAAAGGAPGMEKVSGSIFEKLKQEALYAQHSFSTELLYETYGKALMARILEAITGKEFMELNHMTVYFMNTDREYIRRKNEEFFKGCDEEAMKGYRVKYWLEDQDSREEYMEFVTMELAQAFYNGLGGKAEIQRYVEAISDYEIVVYPTFEV